jgi:hypothetical protein
MSAARQASAGAAEQSSFDLIESGFFADLAHENGVLPRPSERRKRAQRELCVI